jgi:transcriptional regulator with XRE-family HTH domain
MPKKEEHDNKELAVKSPKTFGRKIYGERKERHLSIAQAAKSIGISPSSLFGYESDGQNKKVPSIFALTKIVQFYKVSADYLLGLSNEQKEFYKNEFAEIKISTIKDHIVTTNNGTIPVKVSTCGDRYSVIYPGGSTCRKLNVEIGG